MHPCGGGQVKILHVVPGLDEQTNGIAVAAKQLAAAQARQGDEPMLAERFPLAQYFRADRVIVHSMWKPLEWRAAFCCIVRKLFGSRGFRWCRMPHGCLDPVKRNFSWWKKLPLTPLEWILFRLSDGIVVTSQDERRWCTGWNRRLVDMRLGVETDPDAPRREPAADGALKLLYIGRIHPLKGLDLLFSALAELDKGVCWRLAIVGRDEKGTADALKLQAQALGLDLSRIEFAGETSEAEKRRRLAAADLFVLPTRSENFGLVVSEALAAGVPVVTTKAAPWPGLAENRCGWWTDVSAAALCAALESALSLPRQELRAMGERGRDWMRRDFATVPPQI